MLVDPRLEEVINGERGMLKGISICLKNECLVSAVTLMFSSIDALAALTRPIGQQSTNGDVFRDWVSRFIKPEDRLGCTSYDLWGARCGVLHLYSPDSDYSAANNAQRIYYQWSSGPNAATSRSIPLGSLIITVESLHDTFKQAVHDFIIAATMAHEVKSRVESHLPSLLCYEPFYS